MSFIDWLHNFKSGLHDVVFQEYIEYQHTPKRLCLNPFKWHGRGRGINYYQGDIPFRCF